MHHVLFILGDFYLHPMRAASRALDHGRLIVAIMLMVATAAAMTMIPQLAVSPAPVAQSVLAVDPGQEPIVVQQPRVRTSQFVGPVFTLLAIALLFVPAVIGILSLWLHLGSFGVALRRDYAPLLTCVAFAWTAAHLPAIPWLLFGAPHLQVAAVIFATAFCYWLFLAACCVRVVLGAGAGQAACGVLGALVVCGAGVMLYTAIGSYLWILTSPWVLYYVYSMVASDASMIGSGLRSRQSFRRCLEIATVNPRDADAHYQLGLIYQSRRQYDEAISHFRLAVEIDPSEATTHYQLGRIALEQGRYKEALDYFCNAAELDDKHSSNEVWRDVGIACFHLNDRENSIKALKRYVERREYDPEGLYWLGHALLSSDRKGEAAEQFKRAIEAARSAPMHRRHVVRTWASKARAELRQIG